MQKAVMSHEPRLSTALRVLLQTQRVAALGTIDAEGCPFVSMVPFAIEPDQGRLVLHVSGLALHSQNMQDRPSISLMVMQAEQTGEPVHALARVTLQGQARILSSADASWEAARTAYLARFPEAEPMTTLGDFRFVEIKPELARQVAGFGAARSVDAETLHQLLQHK
jgi:heme iron utilization protein